MALKDKEFWSNIDLIGHLGMFFGGITSKDYEDAMDKTSYKRKVPLDDGTWTAIEDLGNSKETITSSELTTGGDDTEIAPTASGTSYSLHDLFIKIFNNIRYLFGVTVPYITTLSGQCTSSNETNRTILQTVHKHGTNPLVQVLYKGDVVKTGVKINATGDVVIEWASSLVIDTSEPLTVIIK